MTRFWTVQFVGLCLIGWAWQLGWLRLVWDMDQTRMSAGIFALALIGVALAARGKWQSVAFVADCLVLLGLIGTVLGCMIAFSGVDPASAGDVHAVSRMVAGLLTGIKTALMTTLVGAAGFLWLKLSEHLST